MALNGSIRIAANALRANQLALQVVGQNIANANTPGYIREEIVLSPAPTQRVGNLLLGLGVEVKAVVQKLDRFLEDRLRGSLSELSDSETQQSAYAQLEGILGELSDSDLSTALTDFFSGVSDVLNHPENISVRNHVMLQGKTLTGTINRMASRVLQIRSDINEQIIDTAQNVNRLIEEIRVLNTRIASAEGGSVSRSDAVGLRDQRLEALESLARLIDVQVKEQPSGGVVVYSGGDYLVFEGEARQVEAVLESDRGLAVADIHLAQTDAALQATSGELAGLLAARDEIATHFLDQLDEFARTLAFEFNQLYSGGQGLSGYRELAGEFAVTDATQPLDQAGLSYAPANGSFQLLVYNTRTGMTQTHDVFVNLSGLGEKTTLAGLAAALHGIDGISASITLAGKLTISSDSADQEFAFRDDTSGVLAALGLNTFFDGVSAATLGVNEVVAEDPAKFAASRDGIGADTENAVELAAFLDRPLASQNNATITVLYDRLTGETTQASAVAQAMAHGARVFEQTLRGQKLAISGVSLDEEAVNMIAFQRAYQASARYIRTLDELLQIVVSL